MSDTALKEFATFGPVHLMVTNLDRSTEFWEKLIGLSVRKKEDVVELGTKEQTLVVLHPGATHPFQQGYSGLYHLALHVPNEPEFARVLARLIKSRQPISPTDHIMSKAIYLRDPDGITIEITLETPERFRSYQKDGCDFSIIDAQGRIRGGTEKLNVEEVLEKLPNESKDQLLPVGTKIGHVHLYVGDLRAAYNFYQQLGFQQHGYFAELGFADLHAGGVFKHRIAMNTWQGVGTVQAPAGTAGMKYFTIHFDSSKRLKQVIKTFSESEELDERFLIKDSAGNAILLDAEQT